MCGPENTTAHVIHKFISLINTSAITIPLGFKVGLSFKKVDLTNLYLTYIMALMSDTNTYHTSLPCCI